jgi:hypothetical protein
MGRPRKIKRPIGLDVGLRLALPEKRPEQRWKIFCAWRQAILRTTLKREPTDQEIEAQIKLFREPNFDAANCPFGFWDLLKDFVTVFHKENRRKKAQCAAAARWSKENLEKRAKKNKKSH